MIFDKSKLLKIFKLLVSHSLKLKKNENVFIESINIPEDILVLLVKVINDRKAIPFLNLKCDKIIREIALSQGGNYFHELKKNELCVLKKMDAYIGIRSSLNNNELSDLTDYKIKIIYKNYYEPVHLKYRNNKLKSVFIRIPNESYASQGNVSTEMLALQFYKSCLYDYKKLNILLEPFVKLLKKSDKIKIIGPGKTDLQFSIKKMPVIKCTGEKNIPDGELDTVPVLNSVNGRIEFNVITTYAGNTFHFINLDISRGKIINFQTSNDKKFSQIISIDNGAKYFGEFAFALNNKVKFPINDILNDEKMKGTIHLALGNAYTHCDNGNRSSIHWDLILDQRLEKGGGEIYIDDVLVRKNGKFILKELKEIDKL